MKKVERHCISLFRFLLDAAVNSLYPAFITDVDQAMTWGQDLGYSIYCQMELRRLVFSNPDRPNTLAVGMAPERVVIPCSIEQHKQTFAQLHDMIHLRRNTLYDETHIVTFRASDIEVFLETARDNSL
jgi:hypothetical protein